MGNLVVTRQKDQRTILIVAPSTAPTRITVNIADIHGDKCRTAYDAPDSVKIFREELLEQIQREARQAQRGKVE